MDEIDREALTRALELTKAEPERAEWLKSMLKDRSWEEVAHRCTASAMQRRRLRLQLPARERVRPGKAQAKQVPQSTQRYLHRGVARTTTDRFHMGLVESIRNNSW